MNWSVEFFPFFSRELLAGLAVLCVLAIALFAWRGRRGFLLRTLSIVCFLIALANPNLKSEDRQPLSNIAVVAIDGSSSMDLAGRADRARQIEAGLRDQLAQIPNLEARFIQVPGSEQSGSETTNLFAALGKAMADVPPNRMAGALLVTDGQVHDAPQGKARLGFDAPVHALLIGTRGEKDTRIEVLSAPRFGLAGTDEVAEIRAERSGPGDGELATFDIRRETGPVETIRAPYGKTVPIRLRFEHAGPNIVEVDLKPEPGELTASTTRL